LQPYGFGPTFIASDIIIGVLRAIT
jgi:hypothetical protein